MNKAVVVVVVVVVATTVPQVCIIYTFTRHSTLPPQLSLLSTVSLTVGVNSKLSAYVSS